MELIKSDNKQEQILFFKYETFKCDKIDRQYEWYDLDMSILFAVYQLCVHMCVCLCVCVCWN